MSPLDFLQSWYLAQTNDEWERVRGVTIETLDKSGWMVTIDLFETTLHDRTMTPLRQEHSSKDWLVCLVERNQFRGQGDAQKLGAILGVFQNWASAVSKVE
jgi:Immunity protein 53